MTARQSGLVRPYVQPAATQPAARHLSFPPPPPPVLSLPSLPPVGKLPPAPEPPAGTLYPDRWMTGFWLRQYHYHSTEVGRCIGCGSTRTPECGYSRAGYHLMRASLADPSTMPLIGP